MQAKLRHTAISLSGEVLNRVDPLGLRCIMGAIEEKGHEIISLLEDRILPREEILRNLSVEKPDAIWISIQPLAFGAWDFVKEISSITSVPIVIGNVGSRAIQTEKLKEISSTVLIVDGQGEETSSILCDLLLKDRFLKDAQQLISVPNLRWFNKESNREEKNLSRPARKSSEFRISTFQLKEAISRGDVLNARSSSGCDGVCTFCTVRAINNGQGYRSGILKELEYWLRAVIESGKKDGFISMTDDDLAGSLDHMNAVVEIFHQLNMEYGAKLRFNFSTRADHIYHPLDNEEKTKHRYAIWKRASELGLDAIFLGLESGSKTQLRRLGKGCTPETNFHAVRIAKELGIRVEIGFIPLDPLMSQKTWRQEMLDNIKLARFAEVAKTSPTWLAPARIYKESALENFARKQGLLGDHDKDTDEYEVKFATNEIVDFMQDLGPALCQEYEHGTNSYYRFKREFKSLQRRPAPLFQYCAAVGETLIAAELQFAEDLILAESQEEILDLQKRFQIKATRKLKKIEKALRRRIDENYVPKILKCVIDAQGTLNEWTPELRIQKYAANA